MADYTLGVEVTGDASSLEKEFNKAQKAVEDLKKKTEEANKTASGTFSEMSKSIGETSEKLKSFGDKMSELGGKVRGVGIGLTAGLTTPIVMAGKKMFEAASDYQENLNKVDVAFKNNSKQVKTWANNATKQFGLSKNAALEMTSLFGDMGTSMGLSTGESAKMSTSLAGLAGDLSSFKNIPVEEAMTALNGVFTGETESLKRLGIVMTEANLAQYALAKGYGKSYDEMSQAEKVQLRYAYVTDMSKNAVGDYERTSDGAANTMRTFKSSVENLATTLGQNLLPLITPIVKKMTKLVESFGKMDAGDQKKILAIAGAIAALGPTLIILGQSISAIGAIASVFGTIGGAIASVIGWFGALTAEGGALAGVFGSLGAGPIIAIFAWIALAIGLVVLAIKDLWTNSEAFRTAVIEIWTSISTMLTNVWNSFILPVFQAIKEIIMSVVEESLIPLYNSFKQMLEDIAIELSIFMEKAEPFISKLAELFGIVLPPVLETLGAVFKGAFAIISNVLSVAFQTISGVVKNLLKTFGGLIDFLTGVFTGNWRKAWQGIVDMLGGIFGGIGSIMKGAMNGVIGIINGAISGINSLIGTVNKIPGVEVGTIGSIPYLARGTDNWQGGFARMNEGGRGELAYMPSGMVVVPHDVSMKYAKESARAQSGVVSVNNSESIALEYLKVAKKALERPNVLRVNGRDLAYTTGNDFTNYQNNQAIQIKRLRGEV